MSAIMWKLMLPMLRKTLAKNSPDKTPLLFCLFGLKKGHENIELTMQHLSMDKYKGELSKENTFYDLMMQTSQQITEDWAKVTMLIDFENKTIFTQTFDSKNKPISKNQY